MTENRIFEIIGRVMNGSASLLDHEELKLWRTESSENERALNTIRNYWNQKNLREKTESEKIQIEKIQNYAKESLVIQKSKSSRLVIIKSVFRYAAIIILVLSFGFAAGRLFPGYTAEMRNSEISVSRGSRAHVTLPDGSIVWLGHESHLSYPEQFTGNTREVSLTGEAFFDVESDEKHPFLVHTSGPTIRVTGTEFYVIDYPGDPTMQASLVSGKIDLVLNNRVISRMLPGTNLNYIKQTGKLLAGTFEAGYYDFWKKGEYTFVDKPFIELADMMRRIYNVEIVFKNDALKGKRFTGSMGSDDNVYTLLEIFKKSSSMPFTYSIDDNKINVLTKH